MSESKNETNEFNSRSLVWKDSRVHKPACNHADTYAVLYLYCGHVMRGYATWFPTNNYTDGEWRDTRSTNGNPLTPGEVLFWHEFMPLPKDIKL